MKKLGRDIYSIVSDLSVEIGKFLFYEVEVKDEEI